MDFITDLPLCQGFDSIFVVVDRLTKLGHFAACKKSIDAPQLATLFRHEVIRLHGLPDDIVCDRGTQFTSNYWQNVMEGWNVKLNFTTAFHPEANGQTERVNQAVELYLRCFCNYLQDDWVDLLDTAEVALNNPKHSTTKTSPFFANCGFNPRFDSAPRRLDNPAAEDLCEKLGKIWQFSAENMHEGNWRIKNLRIDIVVLHPIFLLDHGCGYPGKTFHRYDY